jgi:hypothetical protein
MSRKRRPLAALALIAMVAVISACGSSAPAGSGSSTATSGSAGTGSHATASKHEQGVKFAECMRKNGVPGFPDPDASGNLTIDAVANGSSLDPSAPAFTQAISACKHLEPAGFTGTKRSSEQQAAGLKFAGCIRQNGVPDFPDPLPNGPLVDTNRIPSSATSSGMSLLQAAMHKCGDLAAAAGVTR